MTRAKQNISIAKIARPKISGVYERKRLFKLLDKRLERSVVWISDPAGSGKTTLVASWLDSRKLPCLWYQMDEGDADIATFFYYMGMAAKKAAPNVRRPLPLLTPEYLAGVTVFSRRYFENLCSRLLPPFLLIFDNYHTIPSESSFHEAFREGLCAAPEGIGVIVISRADPPPAFSTLLAGSKMAVIGWDDIRLTREESGGIVRIAGVSQIKRSAIEQLHKKAGGWTAGLILLVKSMKIADLPIETSERMASEEVFRYFGNQLFDKASADVQNFLLTTAVLPSISLPVAEKLTGNSRAGQVLENLSRSNTFTEKRRYPRLVYQYHPLFRDFLLARMQEAFAAEYISRLRQQAGLLLEESGQIEDAAELFREAGDWEQLIRLTLTHARALMAQGRSKTLRDWITVIPKEILGNTPWLLYWMGMSSMPHDLSLSRNALERAYKLFKKDNDVGGIYLSWSGIVETFVYQWSNFAPLDHWISEIETLLRTYPGFPTPEIEAHVTSAVFCALIHRQPGHPDLPLWEERAKAIILTSNDIHLKMILGSHVILYYAWWTGDQAKAKHLLETLHSAVQMASGNLDPLATIVWRALEAAHLWIVAEKDACMAAVRHGLEVAERAGVHLWDFMLYAQAGHVMVSTGDLESAADYRRRMEFILSTDRRVDICHYYYQMAWGALCENNLPIALENAKTSYQFATECGGPFMLAYTSLLLAEVLIECGRHDEAEAYLREAREICSTTSVKTAEYIYFWLQAIRNFKLGNMEAALAHLNKHLAIGKKCGILNHGGWRSHPKAELYAKALEHGIETEFVKYLIRKRSLMPPGENMESRAQSADLRAQCAKGSPHAPHPMPSADLLETWPWPLRIYTFGRFEIQKDDKP
ncbi:MAG: hypothetical protein ABIN58_10610, partial [candidate division WOR-3 bacterium]